MYAVAALIAVLGIGAYVAYILIKPQSPQVVIEPVVTEISTQLRIGTSVEDRPIERYIFGDGERHLLFVGGMHGGYEWNTVLLAYQFIEHLESHPETIPNNVTIAVIPILNPDGLYRVTGTEGRFRAADIPKDDAVLASGRFNAREVDLNRNFDCKWQPTSTWRAKKVSAGTSAFSEPESIALRDFVEVFSPQVVVFWHSKANAVYASECENGILPETLASMYAYADASKYSAVTSFSAYPVSGDAEGWLASIGIPAITVELQTHESVEWERNLAGIDALIAHLREATP